MKKIVKNILITVVVALIAIGIFIFNSDIARKDSNLYLYAGAALLSGFAVYYWYLTLKSSKEEDEEIPSDLIDPTKFNIRKMEYAHRENLIKSIEMLVGMDSKKYDKNLLGIKKFVELEFPDIDIEKMRVNKKNYTCDFDELEIDKALGLYVTPT